MKKINLTILVIAVLFGAACSDVSEFTHVGNPPSPAPSSNDPNNGNNNGDPSEAQLMTMEFLTKNSNLQGTSSEGDVVTADFDVTNKKVDIYSSKDGISVSHDFTVNKTGVIETKDLPYSEYKIIGSVISVSDADIRVVHTNGVLIAKLYTIDLPENFSLLVPKDEETSCVESAAKCFDADAKSVFDVYKYTTSYVVATDKAGKDCSAKYYDYCDADGLVEMVCTDKGLSTVKIKCDCNRGKCIYNKKSGNEGDNGEPITPAPSFLTAPASNLNWMLLTNTTQKVPENQILQSPTWINKDKLELF
jgi:hypothetical protein